MLHSVIDWQFVAISMSIIFFLVMLKVLSVSKEQFKNEPHGQKH